MDTSYAQAVNELDDAVASAIARVEDRLTKREIAAELRRIASELE